MNYEKLLAVAEELGAWLFAGGIIFCLSCVIRLCS
jgi:hypothetical protein